MRKLWYLLLLLAASPILPQELTLAADNTGRLRGLDLVAATAPQKIRLTELGMTLDRDTLREDVTETREVKQTWLGTIRGIKNSRVVFTSVGGLTAGVVTLPGLGLLILPDGRIWKDEGHIACATREDDSPTPNWEEDVSSAQTQPKPSEIRLALPFSKQAASLVGGAVALRTILWNKEDLLNENLRASGLDKDLTIKVVAVRQVNYEENDPRRSSVGYVDKAFRAFMNSNKADLLLMIVARHPTGGAAGSACQYNGRSDCAAGIVDVRYMTYAVLHELGHLLSARHELGYFACPSGGQRLGTDFVTIMPQEETHIPAACSPLRILQFSNPAATYNGTPTGNATHCNACRIASVAPTVANFRK